MESTGTYDVKLGTASTHAWTKMSLNSRPVGVIVDSKQGPMQIFMTSSVRV